MGGTVKMKISVLAAGWSIELKIPWLSEINSKVSHFCYPPNNLSCSTNNINTNSVTAGSDTYRQHRRKSSVNFRGGTWHFCPKNMYEKLTKFPNFTRFLPENARILHNNWPKKIFPDFFFGGGARALPAPPRLLRLCNFIMGLMNGPIMMDSGWSGRGVFANVWQVWLGDPAVLAWEGQQTS